MKIALVLCPLWTVESPSYTLGILSANLRKHGHHVKCFDLNIDIYRNCKDKEEIDTWQMDEKGTVWYEEKYVLDFINRHNSYIKNLTNKILSYNPDVIGFTAYSTSRHFSYELARRIKEKNKKNVIIFGGPQCFKNCEGMDILKRPYIDAVCFGEGDIAFPKMLDDICKNKMIIGQYPGFGIRDGKNRVIDCGDEKLTTDLNNLPYADYSDFDLDKYTKRLLPVTTSRGCIGNCKFCNESPHWKRYRYRTAKNIFDEISYQMHIYPDIKEFWFNDSLINGNIKMLDELSTLFVKSKIGIKFGGQALIRPEMNIELLTKMEKAGCTFISYGVETGSNKVLKDMGKTYNIDTAKRVIRDTHRAGIQVIFNIIAGLPGEQEEEFHETKRFIESNLIYVKEVSIMPFLLLKGSYLYEHTEQAGIDVWTKDDPLKWKTIDNKNNYTIRMQRFKMLKGIAGKKAYTSQSDEDNRQNVIKEMFMPNLCIELSSNCNMKCYMCAHCSEDSVHGENYADGFMSLDVWNNILEGLKTSKTEIESITLYWLGESLMHPNFKKMLSQLLSLNMSKKVFRNLFINTNGAYFDFEVSNIILEYADYIQNNKGYEDSYLNIHFSLETLDPVVFKRIKGADAEVLNKILKNIDYLVKERYEKKIRLPSLTFGAVVLEDNAEEADGFYNYWKKYLQAYNRECEIVFSTKYFKDKDAVYFRCLDDASSTVHSKVAKQKYAEISGRFEKQLFENKGKTEEAHTDSKRKPCFQLWNMFMISKDGIVTPCCKDRFFELAIGDLNKDNISDVFKGDKIKNLRLDHLNGRQYKYKVCCDCSEPPGGVLSDSEIEAYVKNEGIQEDWHIGDFSNLSNRLKDKRQLNICLVSREYPPETGWGGIGTYTYHLAHGLADRGHNVHVISQSLNGDSFYTDDKVNVHRISHKEYFFNDGCFKEVSLRLEYSRSVSLKLKDIIKKYNIHIVEAPNLSAEGLYYSFSKKTPLVTRLHTHFSEAMHFYGIKNTPDSKLSCLLEDIAVRRSSLITCSTNTHAGLIAHEAGIKKDKIKIIPLGIPIPDEKNLVSEKKERPVVLFVGRLEKRKGPQVLIKAIPLVCREVPEVDFIFIGRDTFVSDKNVSISGDSKHSFKEILLKDIPEGYRKNVRFLGYLDDKELRRYFNLCDVFAAPSLYESFGLVYIEAMSYGKPVIGCGVGGVIEVIKDGITGFLIPPEDYQSLAGSIIALLKDNIKRQKIGMNARNHVKDYFNLDLMIEQTENAYLELVR